MLPLNQINTLSFHSFAAMVNDYQPYFNETSMECLYEQCANSMDDPMEQERMCERSIESIANEKMTGLCNHCHQPGYDTLRVTFSGHFAGRCPIRWGDGNNSKWSPEEPWTSDDYKDPNFVVTYRQKQFAPRLRMMRDLLATDLLSECIDNLKDADSLTVISLGGGPIPELHAFHGRMGGQRDGKTFASFSYDLSPGWRDSRTQDDVNLGVKFIICDLKAPKLRFECEPDVIFICHILLDLWENDPKGASVFWRKILSQVKPGTIIIIVDRMSLQIDILPDDTKLDLQALAQNLQHSDGVQMTFPKPVWYSVYMAAPRLAMHHKATSNQLASTSKIAKMASASSDIASALSSLQLQSNAVPRVFTRSLSTSSNSSSSEPQTSNKELCGSISKWTGKACKFPRLTCPYRKSKKHRD